MIKLSLDMPPSANQRLTRSKNSNRLIKSNNYRTWQTQASWQVKSQLQEQNISSPIASDMLSVMHIVASDRRRRDYDNVAKCINDALQLGGAIKDDALIKCAFSYSSLDREHGGIVQIFLADFNETDLYEATSLINQALLTERLKDKS